MKKNKYLPRIFDSILDFTLKSKGAVLIAGPKWCGKSTTANRFAKTIIDLMPVETRENYINLAKLSPSKFLNIGEKPLLVDEWQHVSFIWDQIKTEVDNAHSFGLYILTGSVTDKEKTVSILKNKHTGNGRIVKKIMRTMSLYESKDSNGSISLSKLKDKEFSSSFCNKNIDDYAYFICRGGWPMAIDRKKDIALQQAIDYYEMIVSEDIFSLDDVPLRKDENRARKVMKAYARNIAIATSDSTIKNDSFGDSNMDIDTFDKYILALKDLYVIEELEAWNPFLRSKTILRTKETRHFIDPSIATAALGLSPDSLFKDISYFGLLFESLAIRDLRVYSESIGAKVYKYRDAKGREADAVIQFRDGSFALIEIKLGGQDEIDKACEKLIKLAADIDTKKTGELSFLMVITKNKVAYKSDSGVYIVPLACLKN